MAQWISCPQCGLKHGGRDDGLCPRCMNAVGSAPAPASTAVDAAPAQSPASDLVTTGSRIAGAVLIVNGVFVALEALIAKQMNGTASPGAGIVVDFIVGIALLRGSPKARHLALLRIALGALVWGGMLAAQGEYFACVLQLIFSGSLALLMAGRPGKGRLATAVAMAAACFLVETTGLVLLARGNQLDNRSQPAQAQRETPE